ncbi:MAG: hypothetical protein QE263_04460 [Vampirovibrionales bacterium]|nr:hypothetical protein [Vampirovibrionales bacterium]
MKMGLLADTGYVREQAVLTFAARHKAKAALMGGDISSYPSYGLTFPPNYSPALMAHSRQGFSIDYPNYSHTSADGDRIIFSAEAGFYKPRY